MQRHRSITFLTNQVLSRSSKQLHGKLCFVDHIDLLKLGRRPARPARPGCHGLTNVTNGSWRLTALLALLGHMLYPSCLIEVIDDEGPATLEILFTISHHLQQTLQAPLGVLWCLPLPTLGIGQTHRMR